MVVNFLNKLAHKQPGCSSLLEEDEEPLCVMPGGWVPVQRVVEVTACGTPAHLGRKVGLIACVRHPICKAMQHII